jgi:hypothetical protein
VIDRFRTALSPSRIRLARASKCPTRLASIQSPSYKSFPVSSTPSAQTRDRQSHRARAWSHS